MDKKAYLQEIERVIENGKYKDNWDSLSLYKVPDWYTNTKFGIYKWLNKNTQKCANKNPQFYAHKGILFVKIFIMKG